MVIIILTMNSSVEDKRVAAASCLLAVQVGRPTCLAAIQLRIVFKAPNYVTQVLPGQIFPGCRNGAELRGVQTMLRPIAGLLGDSPLRMQVVSQPNRP